MTGLQQLVYTIAAQIDTLIQKYIVRKSGVEIQVPDDVSFES